MKIIHFYNFITLILFPLYLLVLLIRVMKKKDNLQSIMQRICFNMKERPSGELIWIHAASVGESMMAITLIENLSKERLQANYLVTTGTLSSAKILRNQLPANAIHQFTPLDNLFIVQKFIKHWKPDLGIFIESEFWPCLLSIASKNCKLILVNARLSDKSYARWKSYKVIFQSIISNFKIIIVQSNSDLKKYQALGCKNIMNFGNLKFANKKLKVDESNFAELKKILADKKIFVASSTHAEDEKVILDVIQTLKNKRLNYYPIIILRHPERRNQLAQECINLGLKFSIKSTGAAPSLEDDLYIVDNFGELGLFYNLAFISFIGGSFGSTGGHNMIEPANFNNIIIVGPNVSKCQNIADDMITQKAAIQINNANELATQIEFFLDKSNNKYAEEFINNAHNFVNSSKETIASYMKEIKKLLK